MKKGTKVLASVLAVTLAWSSGGMTMLSVKAAMTQAEASSEVVTELPLNEETNIVDVNQVVQKIEAEDAILTLPARVANNAGASGGKKVGWIDNSDATVTFTLDAPEAGTYRVDVIAGSDCSNASQKYYINGNVSDASIITYSRGGWDNWQAYPIEVELNTGPNTLTLTHSDIGDSFSELDYINFYKVKTTLDGITLDGQRLEEFNWQVHDYEIDVADLNSLKNVAIQMSTGMDELFEVTIKQATANRPEALISVICEDIPELNQEYRVRFITPGAFSNPLVNYGADPYVTYQGGYYYYVRMLHDREIYVSKTSELSRIGQVEPVLVYKPKAGEPSVEMWAPEIHCIQGKWYIYYTAGAGSNHRMYVVESDTPQGTYEFKGKLAPTTDRWAIDQTILEHNGKLYGIWSGWDGTTDVEQRIYIAEMSDPLTIIGERVVLSIPEYDWELHGRPTINEGPQVIKSPTGVVNIVYSASGSWSDDYCLGALTLRDGGNPMNENDWIKADEPLFKKNMSSSYSTGHACFVTSPDGTEDYIIYHATKGSGDGWGGRGVRTQRFYWNDDGTLDIGVPIDYNSRVNLPSGTIVPARDRYEAEAGILSGSANVVSTYNSSGGKKVTGLTMSDASVTLNVTVAKAGTYKLYVGAATINMDAGFAVQVNNGSTIDKKVMPFNSGSDRPSLCVDNWTGYELEINLAAGANKIVLSKSENLNGVDIDYIELEFIKALEGTTSSGGGGSTSKSVDNSKLKELYQANLERKATDYEEAGYNVYQSALAKVKEVLNNSASTQIEIDEAQASLEKAIKGLVKKQQPPVEKAVPKKGVQKTIGNFAYQVTKSDVKNGTVTLVKPTKKTWKAVTIPTTVTIDGYKFKVSAIGAEAFYQNSQLTRVTIGSNVTTIGSKAFYGATKLKKIIVNSQKLDKVNKDAFKKTSNGLTIKVPKKCIDKYQKLFKNAGIAKNSTIKSN